MRDKEILTHSERMNYSSAGCMFFDQQFVLAGYQPRKQKPFLSGLGGKREGKETYDITALRETIEELFEFQTVPLEWITDIQERVPSKGTVKNGDYIIVLYSFEDLQQILEILQERGAVSELYSKFPVNLVDLLFHRKQLQYPAEISHLTLLPFVNHSSDTPFVSPYFVKDIRILHEKIKSETVEPNV
jgi:hypothetical protein